METFSRETLNPWFITGFADGQGCFTFGRSSKQLSLFFTIKLPAADRAILEAIQEFFGGMGRIYEVSATRCMLRMTRIEELVQLVAHFDAFPLQTQKKGVYAVWREMVELKRDFRRTNREALEHLAIELSSRSPRNQPS